MEEVDSGNLSFGCSPATDPPFPSNIHSFEGKSPHCVCSWLEPLFSVHYENRDQTGPNKWTCDLVCINWMLYTRSWNSEGDAMIRDSWRSRSWQQQWQ